jgi:hypothetical protein
MFDSAALEFNAEDQLWKEKVTGSRTDTMTIFMLHCLFFGSPHIPTNMVVRSTQRFIFALKLIKRHPL